MRTESFEERPNADMVLSSWYRTRDALSEDKMEELHLRLRQGTHVRYSSVDSTGATSSRSNKRDISSILNKVILFFNLMYHENQYLFCSVINSISLFPRSFIPFFFLVGLPASFFFGYVPCLLFIYSCFPPRFLQLYVCTTRI